MLSNPNVIAIVIASLLLLILLFSYKKFQHKKQLGWWYFLIIALAFYSIAIAYSFYLSAHYQDVLNTYDLNGDELFSGNEITPEQEKAMRNVVSDTGRNFVFIVGAVYAIIVSGIVVGVRKMVLKAIK